MRQGGLQLVDSPAGPVAQALSRSGRCVLVSVVGTQGSVPREVGAAMIVSENEASGTIGGGKLEFLATRRARSLLADGGQRLQFMSLALEAESNQCCGGVAVVALIALGADDSALFSRWQSCPQHALSLHRQTGQLSLVPWKATSTDAQLDKNSLVQWWRSSHCAVLLCGAGHVGKAIASALAPLPFSITWWDERADLTPDDVSPNTEVLRGQELPEVEPGALWLILTHRHDLDLDLCCRAVRSRPGFVGLIGSESKRRQFAQKMKAEGFQQDEIARITCPIGLPEIPGKRPEIIAASVAAQLLTLISPDKIGSGIRESEVENQPEYWL